VDLEPLQQPDRTADTARAWLEAARQELGEATLAGRAGRAAVGRYADRVDDLLRRVFAEAAPPSCPVVLLALGGYGRRHLCLHSDVDILVLFDGSIGEAEARFVRDMLHPLWDLRLVLGHQVRELNDFAVLEQDNPEFLLALLDARPLAGDISIVDRFNQTFHQPETHAFILEALRTLIANRHATFDDTVYQLEPDVKEAPGALRDLMAFRAILNLTDPSLARLAPADDSRLDDAEDFLLRVRSIVHLEAHRNQNVLTHELQERAGQILEAAGAPTQRVERLMSEYFRHARTSERALAWALRAAPTPVGVNLVRSRDGIRFVDPERAAREPRSWIGLFQAAIDESVPVADEALTLLQQRGDGHDAHDFFRSAEDRDRLLAFFKPRKGLYARLSEMHDCGLLGRMFPEFRAISSRVVRDFYHKYTVDEHTLLTIRNLVRLTSSSTPSRARFGGLLAELEDPELLVLSLLFHDVGKWRDDDHHVESVRMAQRMLERVGMPAASRDLVEFLIHHHLQMSLVAFRRDTDDPEVVKRFAEVVGTEKRLKMLCLMTLVDVQAVSPDTLTPWREELLWRLYVDTYNHLTLQYGDELIAQDSSVVADLLAGRPADLSDSEIRHFVAGLPRRYLQLFSPAAIYQHVQLSRDIQPDHIHATLDEGGGAWELTVVTLDKPFLFSNICGVLSSFGMDILRGHALTNPNGLVLDIFQFTDQERFLELNEDGRAQFLRVLEDAVSGRADVAARLRAREQGAFTRRGVPRVRPTIHLDNQSSRRYTILDIIANNAIGLLHRISRVMSRHGCDVDLVLISTEGEKAIDVFHITQAGTKLSDAAQRALTADLQRMLEGADEAD
jgi:[protein-PII] uridylyltransferase